MNLKAIKTFMSLGIFIVFSTPLPLRSDFEYKQTNQHTVVAPFGFQSRQPPLMESVKIADFKIGLEAQQVCGYTDWTTTQIHLPKELLSKNYWKNVGQQIVDKAKKTVINLSGALPSMLACNVSPTFCSVLNQAEMMAAFEANLTFETCEVLDGLANTSMLQGDSLRECISKYLGKNPKASNSEAREVCLNNKGKDEPPSKQEKIESTAEVAAQNGSKPFDFAEFLDDLFPTEVKTNNGIQKFDRSGHQYSRHKKSKDFTSKLFLKGITLKGHAMTEVGGTFQGNIENEKDQSQSQLRNAILAILKEMREYQRKGFSDKEIINKTNHLWADKEKWKQNKEPHPIYRPSGSDSEPSYLISPEQILMLLPLVDDNKDDLMSDDLRQVLDRLSSTSANIKVTDKLIDTYRETLKVCQSNPKYQDAIAQRNCDTMLKDISSGLQFLQYQNTMEAEAFKAQQEVQQYVHNVQKEKLRGGNSNTKTDRYDFIDEFFSPSR